MSIIDPISLDQEPARDMEPVRAWSSRTIWIVSLLSAGLLVFFFLHYGWESPWAKLLSAVWLAGWSAGVFAHRVLWEYRVKARAQRERRWIEWNYSRRRHYVIRSGVFALKQSYFNVAAHRRENDHIVSTLRGMGVRSGVKGYGGGYDDAQIEEAIENLRDTRFAVIVASMMHEAGTTITILLGIPSLLLAIIFGAFSLFQVGSPSPSEVPATDPLQVSVTEDTSSIAGLVDANVSDASSRLISGSKSFRKHTSHGNASADEGQLADTNGTSPQKPRKWEVFVYFGLLSLAFFFISGWIFVHLHSLYLRKYVLTIPAERYAAITVNTLESSQIIVLVSYLIHELCHSYRNILLDSDGSRLSVAKPEGLGDHEFLLGRQKDVIWRAFIKHPEAINHPSVWTSIYRILLVSNAPLAKVVKRILDRHFEYDRAAEAWTSLALWKRSTTFSNDMNRLLAPQLWLKKDQLDQAALIDCLYGAGDQEVLKQQRSELIEAFRRDTVVHEYIQAQSREVDSARIESLISALCKRTGMRYEDACEYLFQFSPHLYRSRTDKFRQNIFVLLDMLDMDLQKPGPSMITDRMLKLIRQNHSLTERLIKIGRRQAQNIVYYDMHPRILDIAGTRSCSEAVKHYMSGLADVAQWRRRSVMAKSTASDWQFKDRLYYLLRKSEAHVGLNVHHATVELLSQFHAEVTAGAIEGANSDDQLRYQKAQSVLDLEGWPPDIDLSRKLASEAYKQWLKTDVEDRPSPGESALVQSLVDHFYRLDTTGISYMDQMRHGVVRAFKEGPSLEKVLRWYSQGKKVYIVTFGYSKVVRDVLHNVLEPTNIDALSRVTDVAHPGKLQNIKFAIVLMDVLDTEEALRVKYMCSFGDHRQDATGQFSEMIVANTDFVASLMEENSRVLILTGADAFDPTLKRFAKTGSRRKRFDEFVATCRVKCVEPAEFVILAESFKRVQDLPHHVQVMGEHYHSLELYEVAESGRFCTN